MPGVHGQNPWKLQLKLSGGNKHQERPVSVSDLGELQAATAPNSGLTALMRHKLGWVGAQFCFMCRKVQSLISGLKTPRQLVM